VGRVDDVRQQRRLERLGERALERRDEPVRQLLDEADRVGEEDARAGLRDERPYGRLERREELVRDVHLAARQRAHQRRLAGVRIADERHAREGATAGALRPALLLERRQLRGEFGDAVADLPAVELEVRLAGPLPADAAALAVLARAGL